jgi:hypothetical protein
MIFAPILQARRMAAAVFSGAAFEAPRCAMMRGLPSPVVGGVMNANRMRKEIQLAQFDDSFCITGKNFGSNFWIRNKLHHICDLPGTGTFVSLSDGVGAVCSEHEFVLVPLEKGHGMFFVAVSAFFPEPAERSPNIFG